MSKYNRVQVHKNAEFKLDKINRFPIVSVCWRDAESCDCWIEYEENSLEGMPGVHECVTTGHLIKKTDYFVMIASTYAHSKKKGVKVCNVITIPMSAVIEMTQFLPE